MKLSFLTRKFLLIAILVFAVNALFAQTATTTLILKSGLKITGVIQQAVANEYFKIRLSDGSVITIKSEDIAEITNNTVIAVTDTAKVAGSGARYQLLAGVDFGMSLSNKQFPFMEVRVINGVEKWNTRFGVGVGYIRTFGGPLYELLGTNTVKELSSLTFVPVYLNICPHFLGPNVKFYTDISLGFPIGISKEEVPNGTATETITTTGLGYLNFSPGIRVGKGAIKASFGIKYTFLPYNLKKELTDVNGTIIGLGDGKMISHNIGLSLNIIY
jgi:hypothetical protein